MIQSNNIQIPISGQSVIAATIYKPENTIQGAVIIGPATGIKRSFYTHFATYLAENGYAVVTYDNQGIGDSLKGNVKDCTVSLQDWGYQDQPAVLDYLKKEIPGVRYHWIGHSAGGQLVGLMRNWNLISSMFNVACSSGNTSHLQYPFKFMGLFFMHLYIPLNNLLFGRTRSDWIGLGEQLPKRVAAQWSEWCRGKGYVQTAFGKTVTEHWYHDIDFPALWLNASDDDIAADANVDEMISVFPKMKAKRLKLDPADYGLKEIGHMKFFSRKSKVLWGFALDWLKKHS